jgi:hypothetical protein
MGLYAKYIIIVYFLRKAVAFFNRNGYHKSCQAQGLSPFVQW